MFKTTLSALALATGLLASSAMAADTTVRVLKEAAEVTRDKPGLVVNVAVGYGGRREITDAVRGLLHEHAHQLRIEVRAGLALDLGDRLAR